MKSFKFLAVAGFAAAMLGQSASANSTPHIYVTGSSAFRSAAIAAIAQSLGITAASTPPLLATGGTGNDTSTANTGKTSFIFEGGSIGGTPVTVVATFTGSETGVATVTGSIAIPFLNDSDATSHPSTKDTNNASAYSDVQGSSPNPNYATHIPDFTFSDVYQSTTPFTSSSSTGNYVDGTDNLVGIVTFKWMASVGFPLGTGGTSSASTIISTLSAEPNFIKYLYSTGKAPISMLTGSSGDQHKVIFAAGRNPDSGTRATALADSGYGVTNHVLQYQATISGTTVTSHQLYPVELIGGFISTVSVGNSGEATGGNLRNYLKCTLPTSGLTNETAGTTAAYYMAYLGTSDAAAVEGTTNGGAVELAYKGTPFSITAIYQGQYSFWSYEHVIDRNDLSSPQSDLEAAVISTVQGYTTTSTQLSGTGISITDPLLQVQRAGDGATIKPHGFSF